MQSTIDYPWTRQRSVTERRALTIRPLNYLSLLLLTMLYIVGCLNIGFWSAWFDAIPFTLTGLYLSAVTFLLVSGLTLLVLLPLSHPLLIKPWLSLLLCVSSIAADFGHGHTGALPMQLLLLGVIPSIGIWKIRLAPVSSGYWLREMPFLWLSVLMVMSLLLTNMANEYANIQNQQMLLLTQVNPLPVIFN